MSGASSETRLVQVVTDPRIPQGLRAGACEAANAGGAHIKGA